ncbi:MAG: carbon-nitrogen hydrolase family protein [Pseudomonadota bacterium]
MFLAACVQQRSTADLARNLEACEALVRRAAGYGAALVATPEATPYLGPWAARARLAEPLSGPMARRLGDLARELRIHLLVGSFPEQILGQDGQPDRLRAANTSLLFGPEGGLLASYRKLHLFDVDVPGGVSVRESDTTVPGDRVVTCATPLGHIGLSICYDLRFPELYRRLVDEGAEILAVPAAFTLETGRDHWHALLRARAIETQCWLLAPGQWGAHGDRGLGRSYGHSLIADPWGTVVAECGDGEGLCLAEVDLERLRRIRQGMPVARHRRL